MKIQRVIINDGLSILIDGETPVHNPTLAKKAIDKIIATMDIPTLCKDSTIEGFLDDLQLWVRTSKYIKSLTESEEGEDYEETVEI